jgi:hypothetical protein
VIIPNREKTGQCSVQTKIKVNYLKTGSFESLYSASGQVSGRPITRSLYQILSKGRDDSHHLNTSEIAVIRKIDLYELDDDRAHRIKSR